MAYAAGRRVPAQRRTQAMAQPKPFIAPTLGWITAANLAGAPAGSAKVLDNLVPTSTGLRMRLGNVRFATLTEELDAVECAFAYIGGSVRKLFGAGGGVVAELTAPADPNTAPTPDITGQTSNYYCALNLANPGGNFLMIANGTNNMQRFDGSAWTVIGTGSDPADEIDGVDSDKISHLCLYKNRVWMVEKDTMNAWYLGIDSIAGTATKFPLAGVFQLGGSLLFIATWSFDGGSGPTDAIVFASTEGEYCIYQGLFPADTATWGIIGRYEAAPAMGKNAFLKVGGDLLVVTEMGLIPMSAIKAKDPAALKLAAVSRNIQPDWQREAMQRRGLPWEVVKWTSRNIAYISCPVTSEATPPICFAVNLETGAWYRVTGWDTRCFALHDDQVYFGSNDGRVRAADIGGFDDGELIYHLYIGADDHLGVVGQFKTVTQVRAVFRAKGDFNPQISALTDYQDGVDSWPSAAPAADTDSLWDNGLWDQARWDAALAVATVETYWIDVGASGFAHAPVLQIVSGSAISAEAELVMFDTLFQPGGFAV